MQALNDFIQGARFLIIDDELANVRLIEGNLHEDGQRNVRGVTDPRRAVDEFKEFQPDIVLLDLAMPHINGFAVLEQLQELITPEQNVPIVVLTADITPATRNRALSAGARDFVTKPFDASELRLRTRNLLELRFLHLGLQRQNRDLEARVSERTAELEAALADLKNAQKQAILQERQHAFSQMACGVVHDFNNTLTILQGFCEMLLAEGGLDDPAETISCLHSMNTAACDAGAVVRRLRHFYKPRHEDDQLAMVNLPALLEEAAQLSRPRWNDQACAEGRSIDLRLALEPVRKLLCNPSEIREAILNMIFNAVDAMPAGGSITLHCREHAGQAVVEIADTGLGMSPEVQSRCLEPFFSTKGDKGTGLGLAMVSGIVKRHDGDIAVETHPGKGTTFKITLPFREACMKENGAKAAGCRPLRVLFAEDDEKIRSVITRQLTKAGCFVTTAADGREAMMKLSADRFDVLLTDLSMPKMDGTRLAAAAQNLPDPPQIIMISGFGSMLLPGGEKPAHVDLLLSKPVTGRSLVEAMNSLHLNGTPVFQSNLQK